MMDAKSKTTGPVMMKTGGAVNQHKKMAMGEKVAKKMGGGMMVKKYKKGGMCK
jgi:hypothetical protein